MAEAGSDIAGGGSDGGGIIKIDGSVSNLATFTFERSCRFFPECSIARA
jgi:hypothetical protein